MALITGSWDNTTLVCGLHPQDKEQQVMEMKTSSRLLFYACPKCDPTKCAPHESPCKNQLSAYEYERMLDHIASVIATADENDEVANLRNYRWKRKTYEFCVLQHDGNKMTISVADKSCV